VFPSVMKLPAGGGSRTPLVQPGSHCAAMMPNKFLMFLGYRTADIDGG
jgi:hypothetical protein